MAPGHIMLLLVVLGLCAANHPAVLTLYSSSVNIPVLGWPLHGGFVPNYVIKLNGKALDEIKANHFKIEHDGTVAVFFDKHDEKLGAIGMAAGVVILKKVAVDALEEE